MSIYHVSLKPWKHCSINKDLKKKCFVQTELDSPNTGIIRYSEMTRFDTVVFEKSESTLSLNANELFTRMIQSFIMEEMPYIYSYGHSW